MNLASFDKVVAATFTDELDIYHYLNSTDTTSRTVATSLPSTPSQSSVPCRISFMKIESPLPQEVDATPISTTPKIFCAAEVDIREGDYVVARRKKLGIVIATYKGVVGLPNVFETHQEVLLGVKGYA